MRKQFHMKNEVKQLLEANEWRNKWFPLNNIDNIPFWIPELKEKLLKVLQYNR